MKQLILLILITACAHRSSEVTFSHMEDDDQVVITANSKRSVSSKADLDDLYNTVEIYSFNLCMSKGKFPEVTLQHVEPSEESVKKVERVVKCEAFSGNVAETYRNWVKENCEKPASSPHCQKALSYVR